MKGKSFVALMLLPSLAACAANSRVITSPNGYTMTTLENTKGGVFASRSNVIEKDGEIIVVETNTAVHPAWGLGNTAVMGGAAVGSAYVFAKHLKPDNTTTNVNQSGGGASSSSGADAAGGDGGAGGTASGGDGGDAVAAQQQGQLQGQYASGGNASAKGGNAIAANSNENYNTSVNLNSASSKASSDASAFAASNSSSDSDGGGCFPPGHCK